MSVGAASPRSRPARGQGAPGRKRVPRQVRERQMLEVAGAVFARKGFERSSMAEIAEAAGVTKPMLYAYFDSKEGLFSACAEAAGLGLRERLRRVGEEPGLAPDERLWRGLLEVFEFVEEHRDGWLILYPGGRPTAGSIGPGAMRARDEMAALLTELFTAAATAEGIGAQAAENVEPIAHAFTAATIAAASWWLDHPEQPKDLQVLRLMNFVWMGFGDLLAGRLWLPGAG